MSKYLVKITIYDETEGKHIGTRERVFTEDFVEKYTKYFLDDTEDEVFEELPRHKYNYDVKKEKIA